MQNVELTIIYCFHAEWCHNCPQVEKAFSELKEEMENDTIKFINTDVESDDGVFLSSKYQVRNVPTILVVKNDREIERIVGTRSKEQIKEVLEKWK